MLKIMLAGMRDMADEGLKDHRTFRALWFKQWSDLFLTAYEPGRKVVYTSAYAFPMEILAAFDVVPFDFETSSALMSVINQGLPLMIEAENQGYSPDICSFHRASLGCLLKSYYPEPDLLITTSFYCDGKGKTNDIMAHVLNKRSYYLQVPHEITKASVEYVKGQLQEIIRLLEELTGKPIDEERLRQAIRSSNRSRALQLEIQEVMRKTPCVFSPTDLIGYSINGKLFTGRLIKEDMERQLLLDLNRRHQSGRAHNERHRIYWFAWMPVYASILYEVLKEHGVNIAMCETYEVFWDELDEENSLESLALQCLKNPFIGPTSRRTDRLKDTVSSFGIDGAILFATPACRNSKSAHMLVKKAFTDMSLPFLSLDMDISDPRGYQAEQIRTRLEGFIELMDMNT
mgnify:CR=1 FL=1